ncbi:MAG TPA: hypothetical protein VK981_01085 [Ramlibacter sp.]|nr:hypothetical protein [Ramlibacter sp.]
MKPSEQKPARKSPAQPAQTQRDPGHSGTGTESALRRLKTWERSRAESRGDSHRGPGR